MKPMLFLNVGERAAKCAVCAIVLCSILAGCASSAPLFTKDGRPTTLVQCPAEGSAAPCLEQARGICGGDFDIVEQSTNRGQRNLLFACRAQTQQ
ncbi:MAG TPA: hypothetical protein VL598_10110 [Trinickia sp.]|uniref:hypothetical protein n=1 Tax=Trinickia sp. TaxID=2571163 RepID=UPI002CD9678E|nr:hypothetical protein [Trinickia sp.]HTI18006.1 hypothetical protein [Trinickia sp.]